MVKRVALVLILIGCGASAKDTTTRQGGETASVPATTTTTSTPAPAGAAKPACPHSGQWDACTVAERLDRSGLAPQPLPTPAPDKALGAPTVAYTIGKSELRVFIFPDRKARVAAEEKLDRKGYLTPADEVGMDPLPTLISSENLLALLASRNEHQRERVADAITAGPPQPSR